MQIKDSEERTEFASGALRDMHTGKGRMAAAGRDARTGWIFCRGRVSWP